MNLWVIFLTGLTVGGLTCLAVQGGLLASVIAIREEEAQTKVRLHAISATAAFLVAKLVAYLMLGFLLGTFGGAINIGGQVQTLMQLVAGIYMVLVALNLLNIHPIFRYVIIQPPKILTRLVRNQSKSKDIFAPGLLGVMTIFIPCGTTLAMEALAISSANAWQGALIMGAFILGTMPLFFGIGLLTSFLGEAFKSKFLKIAAVVVLYLGLSSINGAAVALGIPFNWNNLVEKIQQSNQREIVSNSQGEEIPITQTPEIYVTTRGYQPNYVKVSKGAAVNVTLVNKTAFGCASAFRAPSLGISKNLGPNETFRFSFTPQTEGKIQYSCAMGMYWGVIEVI